LLVIEFNKENKKIILSERLLKEPTGTEGGEGGKRKGKGKGKKAAEGEVAATEVPSEMNVDVDEAFREANAAPETPEQPPAPAPTDETPATN